MVRGAAHRSKFSASVGAHSICARAAYGRCRGRIWNPPLRYVFCFGLGQNSTFFIIFYLLSFILFQFPLHQRNLPQHARLGRAAVAGTALAAGGQVDGGIHVILKQVAVLLELVQRQFFQRLALADAGQEK